MLKTYIPLLSERKNRYATSFAFLVNGLIFGNIASHIPDLQRTFQLSEFDTGFYLFIMGLGAITMMPITGWFVHRFGSFKITIIATMGYAILLLPLYWITERYQLAIVLFLIGASNGSMDIGMNDQAIFVERAYKRSIMSSFHAIFSVGGLLSALASSLMILIGRTPFEQALMTIGLILIAAPFFLPSLLKTTPPPQKQSTKATFTFHPKLFLYAILVGMVFMSEGAIADWSAVYMQNYVLSSAASATLAYAAFSATMMIGRFCGDYLINRIGQSTLLLGGGLLISVGMGLALSFPTTFSAIAGFALAGAGLATLVPIIFSAAGNLDGIPSSIGIATVSFSGYSCFLLGPPLIGWLSHLFSLPHALSLLVLFGIIIVLAHRKAS